MIVLGGRLAVVVIMMMATAYCGCEQCTAPYYSETPITASGTIATEGRTIAAASDIPFGTRVWLRGIGPRVVEDRGGAITQGRIDVYFDDHNEALAFGVRRIFMYKPSRKEP